MSSTIRRYFTSFLSIWMPFTCFPCLIVLARIPSIKFNKKVINTSLSCPHLTWKACSLSCSSVFLTLFGRCPSLSSGNFLLSLFFASLYYEKMMYLSNAFSMSVKMVMWFLSFIDMMLDTNWFFNVKSTLHP